MNTNAHFLSHLGQLFLEWKMFQTKVVEIINRHISYDFFSFFFSKIVTFIKITWRNILEQNRPQIRIWCMRIACWVTKATNTLSEYVILIAFPLQRWLPERATMLRYMCIVCRILTWHELKFPSRQKVDSDTNNQLWYFITILRFTFGSSN